MNTRYKFPKHLVPGLNTTFGIEYDKYKEEWKELFDVETSSRAYEEDQEIYGLGHANETAEGASVQFDVAGEGSTTKYNHVKLSHGFRITREMVDDGQYGSLAPRLTRSMVRGTMQTKETRCANVFNNGFDTNYFGGDGKPMLAADHPLARGVGSNVLATPADLSEASLEQALTDISLLTDARGMRIKVMPKCLLVHPENDFNAARILTTARGRVGTDLNDANIIHDQGRIPQGYKVNHFLTDEDAWFIRTDCPDSLKFFQRQKLEQDYDEDGKRGVFEYWCTERYSVGWTDWRGVYGSAGA